MGHVHTLYIFVIYYNIRYGIMFDVILDIFSIWYIIYGSGWVLHKTK